MNVENLKKWAAALRSGEYKQGFGALHPGPGSYCVWGVAADVSQVGKWEEEAYVIDSEKYFVSEPPMRVINWAGQICGSSAILWDRDKESNNLVSLNDQGTLNFDQLADVIDALANGWDLTIGAWGR